MLLSRDQLYSLFESGKIDDIRYSVSREEDEIRIFAKHNGLTVGRCEAEMMQSAYWYFEDFITDDEYYEYFPMDQVFNITGLYVIGSYDNAEQYRGKGIARELMKRMIDHAKKFGFRQLHLNASPIRAERGLELTDLVGFYESCGFTEMKHQGENVMMYMNLDKVVAEAVISVYRGTADGNYSGVGGAWNGAGTYFSDSRAEASLYGTVREYEIELDKPFDLRTITDPSVDGSGMVRLMAGIPALADLNCRDTKMTFRELDKMLAELHASIDPSEIDVYEGSRPEFHHVSYEHEGRTYTMHNRTVHEINTPEKLRLMMMGRILYEKYDIAGLPQRITEAVNPQAFSDALASMGYDGIIAHNSTLASGNEYVVFDKSKIKPVERVEEGYVPEQQARDTIFKFTHYKSGENTFPRTTWAHWFQSADRKSKKYIVRDIENNRELQDSMLSLFYDVYKRENGFDGSFEAFLDSDVVLYRGVTTADSKSVKSEGFDAYTVTKLRAQAHSDNGEVVELTIKPVDTYGAVNYVGDEIEVLVPREMSAETLGEELEQLLNSNGRLMDDDATASKISAMIDSGDLKGAIKYVKDIINGRDTNRR